MGCDHWSLVVVVLGDPLRTSVRGANRLAALGDQTVIEFSQSQKSLEFLDVLRLGV